MQADTVLSAAVFTAAHAVASPRDVTAAHEALSAATDVAAFSTQDASESTIRRRWWGIKEVLGGPEEEAATVWPKPLSP